MKPHCCMDTCGRTGGTLGGQLGDGLRPAVDKTIRAAVQVSRDRSPVVQTGGPLYVPSG